MIPVYSICSKQKIILLDMILSRLKPYWKLNIQACEMKKKTLHIYEIVCWGPSRLKSKPMKWKCIGYGVDLIIICLLIETLTVLLNFWTSHHTDCLWNWRYRPLPLRELTFLMLSMYFFIPKPKAVIFNIIYLVQSPGSEYARIVKCKYPFFNRVICGPVKTI